MSMLVSYTISTPMMNDAREQAVRRAHAEGYTRVTVRSIRLVSYQAYEVNLLVIR